MTREVILIGLGRIGLGNDDHRTLSGPVLTHAKALALSTDFSLQAAIDPSDAARARFSASYGTPAFATLEALPPTLCGDLVVIATPTDTHLHVVQALIHRCPPKAILIEKPMGGNLDEARAIADLCVQHGTLLFVNFHRSVLPSTKRIAEMITLGEIRKPYLGFAVVSGGRLNDGSHMVDLLTRWLGPVTSKPCLTPGQDYWVTFGSSRVLISESRSRSYSIFEVTLLAENGRLRFDGWNDRWWWEGVVDDPLTAGYSCLAVPDLVVPNDVSTFMTLVYSDLARSLDGRAFDLPTGGQAISVHETLDEWA